MKKLTLSLLIGTSFFFSCKKDTTPTNPTPTDPCLSVSITVTATPTTATPCATTADGSISVSASGSTGFTYKLNSGAYQASGIFSGLTAGSYTVTAKDANGCTKSQTVTVSAAPAGTNFTNVKNIITSKCGGCHLNGGNDGSANFDNDCSIVSKWDRINIRCVTQGGMPPGSPLSSAQKAQITAWVNAGHRYTD